MTEQRARTERRSNIQEVARLAGVSKTTVSHVISGNRPVSSATRERVERVMAELGFRPNYFAQALNSQRSRTVALVAQDITNPFYPALARGLQIVLASADQVVLLFDAGAGPSLTHAFVDEVIQRRLDGVVIAVDQAEAELARLTTSGVPVVAVGSSLSDLPMDWVSADDRRIGFDATREALARGHRRIATITGPPTAEPARSRLAGYRDAMAEAGLEVGSELVESGDWTRDSGAAALRRLLGGTAAPTAVICSNDLMAIGALDAAVELGLSVPERLAIVGVDDIDAASLVRPSLSTIRVPAEEIGRAAGDLLLRRIREGSDGAYRHVRVQHAFIDRHSI
jgi:DNA-binding LacI/PurR family transcriptional regulator